MKRGKNFSCGFKLFLSTSVKCIQVRRKKTKFLSIVTTLWENFTILKKKKRDLKLKPTKTQGFELRFTT